MFSRKPSWMSVMAAALVVSAACRESSGPENVDRVEATIGPSGGTVVTPSGAAGVVFPPGALSQQVLVIVEQIEAPSTPGAGPLPTTLKQYPPYYEFTTSPAVAQFGDSVRVGVCQVTNPSDPLYAPEEAHDRLRLAHRVGSGIEVLERVAVNDFLICTNVTASSAGARASRWQARVASAVGTVAGNLSPRSLYAAHGGLGGKVKSFSPFGAVDPGAPASLEAAASPAPTAGIESAVTTRPSVIVKDAAGNRIQGATVTFEVKQGGGTITGANVSTDANGVATVGSWTLGPTPTLNVLEARVSGEIATTFSVTTVWPRRLAVIDRSVCAMTSTGQLYCWGTGGSAYAAPSSLSPIVTSVGNLAALGTGHGIHFCATTGTGTGVCWGSGPARPAGSTGAFNPGGGPWAELSVGRLTSCGLSTGGTGYCWGINQRGEGGVASLAPFAPAGAVPNLPVDGGLTFKSIVAGWIHACGITPDGSAYCWGDNSYGQIGIGIADTVAVRSPTRVVGSERWLQISTGGRNTCGITTEGRAMCWGANPTGQLGDGTTTNRSVPTRVTGETRFTQVVTSSGLPSVPNAPSVLQGGIVHTCALSESGAAYCWGWNGIGQLGDGTTTDRLSPVAVSGGLRFTALGVGEASTCGMRGGTVWCWGYNVVGQLGNGTTVNSSLPMVVLAPFGPGAP